ncbi:MAG: phosphoribosylformylglycinamidine synthase subunit PurS, partial [Dehalococcoidia bacterium]|nr:phosphoribosylformylglycinamidine synthase subunit PurS [Dehalococcoidia bacterium]
MHRIEVYLKSYLPDAEGPGLVGDIRDLGIIAVSDIRVVDIYWLDADLTDEKLELICQNLLADPVTQEYRYGRGSRDEDKVSAGCHVVEIAYNAGVTDPIEASVMKAVRDLGIENVRAVKTAKRYIIEGQLDEYQLEVICRKLLMNPIIQHIVKQESIIFPENPQYRFELERIDILKPSEVELSRIRHQFGFTNDELQAIMAYFHKQSRNPTDAELETLAQTWSEHCVHKTFKGKIRFDDITIDNLLKSTVMKATEELNKPWCLSVFEDNAGVIDFDG